MPLCSFTIDLSYCVSFSLSSNPYSPSFLLFFFSCLGPPSTFHHSVHVYPFYPHVPFCPTTIPLPIFLFICLCVYLLACFLILHSYGCELNLFSWPSSDRFRNRCLSGCPVPLCVKHQAMKMWVTVVISNIWVRRVNLKNVLITC